MNSVYGTAYISLFQHKQERRQTTKVLKLKLKKFYEIAQQNAFCVFFALEGMAQGSTDIRARGGSNMQFRFVKVSN